MATGTIKNTQSRLKVFATKEDNISIAAQSGPHYCNLTITKEGYTPIGIVGWIIGNASENPANPSKPTIYQAYLSSSTNARIAYRYDHTSDAKVAITVFVLYEKNN